MRFRFLLSLTLLGVSGFPFVDVWCAAARETPAANKITCSYTDHRFTLSGGVIPAEGALVNLYDANGVQVMLDLVRTAPDGTDRELLASQYDDFRLVAGATACAVRSDSTDPELRICAPEVWVDEGTDPRIEEAASYYGEMLLRVSTKYKGLFSGLRFQSRIATVGVRVDQAPIRWYPIAPGQSSLLILIEQLGKPPSKVTIGVREFVISKAKNGVKARKDEQLLETDAICLE